MPKTKSTSSASLPPTSVAKMALERFIWEHSVLMHPDYPTEQIARLGNNLLYSALVLWLTESHDKWEQGVLIHAHEHPPSQIFTQEQWIEWFDPAQWAHPLEISQEHTMEGFLTHNVAIRAFAKALEKTLLNMGVKTYSSTKIVQDSAQKMHPVYLQQAQQRAEDLLRKLNETPIDTTRLKSIGWFAERSPLMNLPTPMRVDFLSLILLLLQAQLMSHASGLSVEEHDILEEQRRWCDKLLKHLKKQYASQYPYLFNPPTYTSSKPLNEAEKMQQLQQVRWDILCGKTPSKPRRSRRLEDTKDT